MKINCKEIADKIIDNAKNEIRKVSSEKPILAILRHGEDVASDIYVRNKMKACERAGIKPVEIRLDGLSKEEMCSKMLMLNIDEKVKGIMLQLPTKMEKDFEKAFISLIAEEKDVDAMTEDSFFKPATLRGVEHIVESVNENYNCGAYAVVFGRSEHLGEPIRKLLQNKFNYTVTVIHSKSRDYSLALENADLIITVVGDGYLFDSSMVKKGATVIDVGITRDSKGKIQGDYLHNDVFRDDINYTPVPSGCGLLTVAYLIDNVLLACCGGMV